MNFELMLVVAVVAAVGMAGNARAQTNQPGNSETLPSGGMFTAEPWSFKGLRDPFWPVGYQPTATATSQQVAQVSVSEPPSSETVQKPRALQWPEINIKGITRTGDGRRLALVSGAGLAEVGSLITLERDGFVFRWRVESIDDRGITCTRLDATPAEKKPKERKTESRPIPVVRRWDEDAAENATGDTNSAPARLR